jgi:hypothetical protein
MPYRYQGVRVLALTRGRRWGQPRGRTSIQVSELSAIAPRFSFGAFTLGR